MKYRKRPVVIEAMQLTEDNLFDVYAWVNVLGGDVSARGYNHTLAISTLEGEMIAQVGDYVIQGIKGEFYPCKPDIFAATYEEARSDTIKFEPPLNMDATNKLLTAYRIVAEVDPERHPDTLAGFTAWLVDHGFAVEEPDVSDLIDEAMRRTMQ